MSKPYTVKIRRHNGSPVRPEAEQLDGKTFQFNSGWVMGENDPYPGETAMLPMGEYPDGAPIWIASGDLIPANESQD